MAARLIRFGLAAFAATTAGACLAPAALPAQAMQIEAGVVHTCALTTAGGVQCWGYNNAGQLGDGSSAKRRARPVNVAGLTSGVTQIATGAAHSCALTAAGGVKCWGDNSIGELGDGTFTERHVPVNVSGLTTGVQAIYAGGINTCAILNSGEVRCWGDNGSGQVGNGTTGGWLNTPVTVTGFPSDVVALDLNYFNACALLDTGAIWCWGDDSAFQLGDGAPKASRNVPTAADEFPASGLVHADVGFGFTCVLDSGGGVSCLGANHVGQLGLGTSAHVDVAAVHDVLGLSSGAEEIRTGASHACAVMSAGGVWCWGSNSFGELGPRRPGEHRSPRPHQHTAGPVSGLRADIDHLALGWEHSCALTATGEILCWGRNALGHLGDNGTHSHARPAYVYGYGGVATSTKLTTSRHPARLGQRVRYTARVRPAPGGGQVHFSDRGKKIKGCNAVKVNANGVARCTVRWKVAGVKLRIRATFWGHVRFNQSRSAVLRVSVRH